MFFTASHVMISLCVGYGMTIFGAMMATQYTRFRVFGWFGGAVIMAIAFYTATVIFQSDKESLLGRGALFGVEASHDRLVRGTALFSVGFCYSGRLAFLSATLGLDLAGAIGFYGVPVGAGRSDIPAPADLAASMTNPILGLFGAADQAIPPGSIAEFDDALSRAGVEHRFVSYDGAPHGFFDRKAADFADASSQAWAETLTFVRGHTPSPVAGG